MSPKVSDDDGGGDDGDVEQDEDDGERERAYSGREQDDRVDFSILSPIQFCSSLSPSAFFLLPPKKKFFNEKRHFCCSGSRLTASFCRGEATFIRRKSRAFS